MAGHSVGNSSTNDETSRHENRPASCYGTSKTLIYFLYFFVFFLVFFCFVPSPPLPNLVCVSTDLTYGYCRHTSTATSLILKTVMHSTLTYYALPPRGMHCYFLKMQYVAAFCVNFPTLRHSIADGRIILRRP
jgi:hypothetical protein